MNWTDVKNAAPDALKLAGAALAATGVGAPIGLLVGGLGAVVGQLIGKPPTPENVAASLQDPALQEKWMEFQANHETELQKLVIDRDAAIRSDDLKDKAQQLSDVQDARDRDVHIIQATGHNWRADILAYSAIVLFGGVVARLMYSEIPAGSSRDLLFYALGSLTTIVIMVYSFEFGASQGDKTGDQNSLIKALKDKAGMQP